MKIIFTLLVAVCVAHLALADDKDPAILGRLVNSQKKTVENIIEDLTEFQQRMYEKVEIKINNIKSDAMLENEQLVRDSLDEIRKSVAKAQEAGKNGEPCYETANVELDTLSRNGNDALNTCLLNAMSTFEAPLKSIENTIETGRKMVTDINSIIPDCYSAIFIRMQNCVMRRLVLTRSSVKKLQANAKGVKRTVTSASYNAQSAGRSCATRAVSDVRTGSTEVRVKAGSCVRNLS